MKLRHALLLALAVLATLSANARWAGPRPPTEQHTVILVRHAEKATDDPRDPHLSAAGVERAQALARLLARARPARLYASEFRRTQETLAPLAQALTLQVETIPAAEPDRLVQAIHAAPPGATLVVAGHSNTLPALAARLGAPLADLQETAQGPMLGDAEYDRVFVLTLPPPEAGVRATVLELRYGR